MNLDDTQKTMLAIVSVFENGRTKTYGQTFWHAKTLELSGGLLMASTLSGNLGNLLKQYRSAGGNLISNEYIDIVAAKDPTRFSDEHRKAFQAEFKAAGTNLLMQETQKEFFATQFLAPAEAKAAKLGITEPLGRLVILDSIVQGALGTVIKTMPITYPNTKEPLNEWDWVKEYVKARINWLLSSSNPLLHQTVDRLGSIQPLIDSNNWKLDLPLVLKTKGYTITTADI